MNIKGYKNPYHTGAGNTGFESPEEQARIVVTSKKKKVEE